MNDQNIRAGSRESIVYGVFLAWVPGVFKELVL